MITLGCDIGTRFIKTCIVKDSDIVGFSILEPGRDIKKNLKNVSDDAIKKSGVFRPFIRKQIACGFGADFAKSPKHTASIASCLARGAYSIDKNIRTVIDVGGLFITIVSIDKNGFVSDTCQNERCASGSGKFIETVARSLEMPISSVSECSSKASTPYQLSNDCAVFAESELISLVNSGSDAYDLIAGVILSIASKVTTMSGKMNVKDKIVLSGGVAKIDAFRVSLQKNLGMEISTLPIDSQIIAAYGAALLATGSYKKGRGK